MKIISKIINIFKSKDLRWQVIKNLEKWPFEKWEIYGYNSLFTWYNNIVKIVIYGYGDIFIDNKKLELSLGQEYRIIELYKKINRYRTNNEIKIFFGG